MSEDINSITLVGRLGGDATLKYTNSGSAVSNLSIAVNRSRKQGEEWIEEVSFFNVTIFGRRGESLNQYLTKGTRIAVTGYLKQERWNDKETQEKRSKTFIVANNIQLLGSPQDGSQNNSQSNSGGYGQRNDNNNRDGNPPKNQQHNRGSQQNNSQGGQNQVGNYKNNNQGNNSQNFNGRPGTNNAGNNKYNSQGQQNNKPSYENYPSGNQGGNGNFEDDIPF